MKEEKHLLVEIYGGIRSDMGMKTFVRGPMDFEKVLRLRFRVADLDLPEGRREIPVVAGRREK